MSLAEIARSMMAMGFASALVCAPAFAADDGEENEFNRPERRGAWPVGPASTDNKLGEKGLTPEQRLDIIESHHGIKSNIFSYSVAKDRKLIVSFRCKVAGKIYRPLTQSCSVTAAPLDKSNRGVIRFTSARGQQAGSELWTLGLWVLGNGAVGRSSAIFTNREITARQRPGAGVCSTGQYAASEMVDGTDYELWSYVCHDTETREAFSIRLSCRIVPMVPNDSRCGIEVVKKTSP